MLFSHRVERMHPSSTLALVELASKLRREGREVISLAVGEPDFITPHSIIEAAYRAMKEGRTHYTPPLGIPELREKIAEKYRAENQVDVHAENVLVTPAKMAIFIAVASFVNDGDEVLVPDPGWVSYPEIVHFAGGKPVGYMLDERKNFRIDIEDLASKVTRKTKVLMINSPSNPTGGILTEGDLKAIRDLVLDNGLILISDEIYEKIIYEGEHISPGKFEELFPYTVIVNGFSKSHAMTGWRIGYLIAPAEFIPQLAKVQQHTISCAPSISQYAALQALEEKESIEKMVIEFRRRREFVYQELREMSGITVNMPPATFYMFPRYHADMPSAELAEKILQEKFVAVTPGAAFGENGEWHFRISFATSMEKLKMGMERLHEFFENL